MRSRWAVFAALIFATIAWCATLPQGILIGDDLALVRAVQSGHLNAISALTDPGTMSKYRPLSNVLFAFIIPLAGNHFGAYEAINILVQCASAVMVAAIVLRATGGKLFLAFCAGIAFATSRFAYYQILQAIGLFEGVALLFALFAIYHAVCAYQLRLGSHLVRTLGWSVLAVLADERYLALLPFVATSGLFFGRSDGYRTARAAGLGALAFGALYYVLKRFVFHAVFVTATSGKALTLAPDQFFGEVRDAAANLIGFNIGPEYLAGKDVSLLGWTDVLLGLFACAAPLLVIGLWTWKMLKTDPGTARRNMFLAVALFLPVLASACVSSRLEFRWLYASYAVFLIAAACAAGTLELDARRLRIGSAATAVVLISASVYYRQYLHQLYFVYEMQWGTTIHQALVEDRPNEAVIVTHDDQSIDLWTFRGRTFLDEYGFRSTQVAYVSQMSDVAAGDAKADVFEKVGVDMLPRRRSIARDQPAAPADAPGAAGVLPAGIITASGAKLSGIYPAQGGEGCCWAGPDLRFSVRVPNGTHHQISMRVYVPKTGPFLRSNQTAMLLGGRDRVFARANVPSGDLTTVTLALPADTRTGIAVVHLRFARSFVPAKTGTGGDVRDLAAIVQSVSLR